jgi:hypothetical protein
LGVRLVGLRREGGDMMEKGGRMVMGEVRGYVRSAHRDVGEVVRAMYIEPLLQLFRRGLAVMLNMPIHCIAIERF